MSPLVFRTSDKASADVEIQGVGLLGAGGRGGIPIEEAARHLPELQERDARGAVVLDDDGNPTPLTGAKLTAAARQFAEERGLVAENVKDDQLAAVRGELGVKPDRPDAREVSLAEGARLHVGHVNHDPQELSEGPAHAGTPAPPPELTAEQEQITGTGAYHPSRLAADDTEGGADGGGGASAGAQGSVAAGGGTAAGATTGGGS